MGGWGEQRGAWLTELFQSSCSLGQRFRQRACAFLESSFSVQPHAYTAWVRIAFFIWDTHKSKIVLGKCAFRTRIHKEEVYGVSCRMEVASTASASSSGSDEVEKCLIFRAHSHRCRAHSHICMYLFVQAHTCECTHTYDTDHIWPYLLPCLSKFKFLL